jgi:hypothetical protein
MIFQNGIAKYDAVRRVRSFGWVLRAQYSQYIGFGELHCGLRRLSSTFDQGMSRKMFEVPAPLNACRVLDKSAATASLLTEAVDLLRQFH